MPETHPQQIEPEYSEQWFSCWLWISITWGALKTTDDWVPLPETLM